MRNVCLTPQQTSTCHVGDYNPDITSESQVQLQYLQPKEVDNLPLTPRSRLHVINLPDAFYTLARTAICRRVQTPSVDSFPTLCTLLVDTEIVSTLAEAATLIVMQTRGTLTIMSQRAASSTSEERVACRVRFFPLQREGAHRRGVHPLSLHPLGGLILNRTFFKNNFFQAAGNPIGLCIVIKYSISIVSIKIFSTTYKDFQHRGYKENPHYL